MAHSFGVRRSATTHDAPATTRGAVPANAPAEYGNTAVQQALRGSDLDGLGPAIRDSLEVAPPIAAAPSQRGTLARAARDLGAGAFMRDDEEVSEADAHAAIARSAGTPLDAASAARFGAALGCDLSHVRVHTDAAAAEAAEALRAHAFALGADIFFAAGEYAPSSAAGDELLAHELTHVKQHAEGRLPTGGGVSSPGDAVEREAEATAQLAVGLPAMGDAPSGSTPSPCARAAAPILRATDEDAEAEAASDEESISLDDIMGDGMATEVDRVVGAVDAAVAAVRAAFAALPAGAFADYAWHADGAEGLADALGLAVDALVIGAARDDDGALTWDDATYLAVNDLMDRNEAAVVVLGEVLTLAQAPALTAYAQLFAQVAALGLAAVEAALLEGEAAFEQLELLVEAFREHRDLMWRYAVKGLVDVAELTLPAAADLGTWVAKLKDVYGSYKFVNAWITEPDPNPWAYAKAAKTMSWPGIKGVLSSADGALKDSVPWVDLVWNITKTSVNVAAVAKEVALLQDLLDLVTQVRADNKTSLENYAAFHQQSQAVIALLTTLEGSERAAKDYLDATEARITEALTGWGHALYEVGGAS